MEKHLEPAAVTVTGAELGGLLALPLGPALLQRTGAIVSFPNQNLGLGNLPIAFMLCLELHLESQRWGLQGSSQALVWMLIADGRRGFRGLFLVEAAKTAL